jgi:molybdopterin synthase catalytic subunit
MIRVQSEPIDLSAELAQLRESKRHIGATAVFLGSMREMSDGRKLDAMTLEHYPGMTEAALADIEKQARDRWPLQDTVIIHRYGEMRPGDDIVLVITTSAHREAAFAACQFLMDWLKTKAPFWKLESGDGEARWVDARDTDDAAAARWNR